MPTSGSGRSAFDLAGRDSVLVGGHLEHDQHPGPNGDLRAVHHGPGQYRELLATRCALPQTTRRRRARARGARSVRRIQEVATLVMAAMWTNRGALPAQRFEVLIRGCFIGD